jgi:hypothetical protein
MMYTHWLQACQLVGVKAARAPHQTVLLPVTFVCQ